jgi:FKBP-type peptidyl-prolyl cis-trans isomerase
MKVKNGDSVKVHYIGTLNDGNEFDNSYKRGSTLDFKVGGGQMIKGFDNAVVEMEVLWSS